MSGDEKSIENSKPLGRPPNGTPDWADTFLAEVQAGSHVRAAVRAAGVDISMPYKRSYVDKDFERAWNQAARVGTRALEAEAGRRAYHGTLKPVFQKGVEVGKIREYSDTLLMFLLRARRPKKYRENVEHKHSGAIGHVVMQITDKIDSPVVEPAPTAVIHVNGTGKHDDKKDR